MMTQQSLELYYGFVLLTDGRMNRRTDTMCETNDRIFGRYLVSLRGHEV